MVQLILYGAIGQTYDQNTQIYIQSSHVNFITPRSQPTIVLQGGQDFVVSPSQSNFLINKLNSENVPNQFVFYMEDGHGFFATNYLDAYNKIEEFIKLHVK
ncbi:MAG: prolyl oligopeptidase family serine peptidase [Ginsengibacter sp.]